MKKKKNDFLKTSFRIHTTIKVKQNLKRAGKKEKRNNRLSSGIEVVVFLRFLNLFFLFF